MGKGHAIKITRSRIGSDFLHVADDYFVRPAAEDFWRLEAAEGDQLVVARLVTDEAGMPQINEVGRSAVAAQVQFRRKPTIPDAYVSMALSRNDEVLLLDEAGNTYLLAEAAERRPHRRFANRRVEQWVLHLADIQTKMLADTTDERWAGYWRRFLQFLVQHGPVPLHPDNPLYRQLLTWMKNLFRVVALGEKLPEDEA